MDAMVGIGCAGVERVHVTSHELGDDIEPACIFYPVLGISIHKTAGVCWKMMFQYTAVVLSHYLGLVSEYGRQKKSTETGTNKQYNLGRLIISIRLPLVVDL